LAISRTRGVKGKGRILQTALIENIQEDFMGTQPGATPCLLTPVTDEVNTFNATAGALSIKLEQVSGQTAIDCVNSKVTDLTDPNKPIAVNHSCDQTTFSLQLSSGKTYLVTLRFVQLVNPFSAQANLKEACGQLLDTIDATNLLPGYIIVVA
jgi:hypothetical protein